MTCDPTPMELLAMLDRKVCDLQAERDNANQGRLNLVGDIAGVRRDLQAKDEECRRMLEERNAQCRRADANQEELGRLRDAVKLMQPVIDAVAAHRGTEQEGTLDGKSIRYTIAFLPVDICMAYDDFVDAFTSTGKTTGAGDASQNAEAAASAKEVDHATAGVTPASPSPPSPEPSAEARPAGGGECPACKGMRGNTRMTHNGRESCPDCNGTGKPPTPPQPPDCEECGFGPRFYQYTNECKACIEASTPQKPKPGFTPPQSPAPDARLREAVENIDYAAQRVWVNVEVDRAMDNTMRIYRADWSALRSAINAALGKDGGK